MSHDKQVRAEAKKIVKEFKAHSERGEFRNKLGRIWWPIWCRVIIPTVSLGVAAAGGLGGIICGTLLFASTYPITKGFSINVQNIAIRNAGILGKSLKNKNMSEELRKESILEYLRQSGALFFNTDYVKKHPEDIQRMANGQTGEHINNLIALTESNLTRRLNYNQRNQKPLSLKDRLAICQMSYATYKEKTKENKQNRPTLPYRGSEGR